MNKNIKEAISTINKSDLQNASENNFKIMYAEDIDYEVKQTDVLYIIIENKLHKLYMRELHLICWYEADNYSIEDNASVNYYYYKQLDKLVITEMNYQIGYCIAYFSSKEPTKVAGMVKVHKQHYIDMGFIRKLRITSLLIRVDLSNLSETTKHCY